MKFFKSSITAILLFTALPLCAARTSAAKKTTTVIPSAQPAPIVQPKVLPINQPTSAPTTYKEILETIKNKMNPADIWDNTNKHLKDLFIAAIKSYAKDANLTPIEFEALLQAGRSFHALFTDDKANDIQILINTDNQITHAKNDFIKSMPAATTSTTPAVTPIETTAATKIAAKPAKPLPSLPYTASKQPTVITPTVTTPIAKIETKPVEIKTIKTKPVKTKTVAIEPVTTKPTVITPPATKPVKTKPVKTKTVEIKPVAIEPVTIKPTVITPPAAKPAKPLPTPPIKPSTIKLPEPIQPLTPISEGILALQEFRKMSPAAFGASLYVNGTLDKKWLAEGLKLVLNGASLTLENKMNIQGELSGNATELVRELLHNNKNISSDQWQKILNNVHNQVVNFIDTQLLLTQEQSLPTLTEPSITEEQKSTIKTSIALPSWISPTDNTFLLKEFEIEMLAYIFKHQNATEQEIIKHFTAKIPSSLSNKNSIAANIKEAVNNTFKKHEEEITAAPITSNKPATPISSTQTTSTLQPTIDALGEPYISKAKEVFNSGVIAYINDMSKGINAAINARYSDESIRTNAIKLSIDRNYNFLENYRKTSKTRAQMPKPANKAILFATEQPIWITQTDKQNYVLNCDQFKKTIFNIMLEEESAFEGGDINSLILEYFKQQLPDNMPNKPSIIKQMEQCIVEFLG